MSIVGSGHKRRLRERLAFLEEKIEQSEGPKSYDIKEAAALRWALKQIDSDERNVIYRRGYNSGQKSILEFYQKTLRKAVHSGNVDALQFLLDRTNEWLDEKNS